MDKERNQPFVFEQVIPVIEALSEMYRLDTRMSSDRARLYGGWLDETAETIKELSSRWSPTLKTTFAQIAEHLLKHKFFKYGTDYGTGYGARPLVEISRGLKHFAYFSEEETTSYLKLLEKIYSAPQFKLAIPDPLYFFDSTGSEIDRQFVHPLVKKLNSRLERAESCQARRQEMNIVSCFVDITTKAVQRGERLSGFIYLNGEQILDCLNISHQDKPQKTSSFCQDLEKGLYCLGLLPPQVKKELLRQLEIKAKAIKNNQSDYETPGLSETTLNRELADIRREIELVFYQTLAENL